MGAAGGAGAAVRVSAFQRAASAAVGDRHSPTTRRPARARSAAISPTRRSRPRSGSSTRTNSTSIRSLPSGAIGMCIDEFNGDNFDHGQRSASSAAAISGQVRTNGRPIESTAVPPGTPHWGAKWKQAMRDNYLSTMICGAACTAPATATRRTISISIPPTRTGSAGR